MIAPITGHRWLFRLIFVGLCALILFFQVLPLHTAPPRVPGPDLMLCLAFAFVQRRPDFVPLFLLTVVFLMADFVLMRPPGLWTALVLLASEFLRNRHIGTGEVPFPAEWLLTAAAISAVYTLYVLVLGLSGAVSPAKGMLVMQAVFSILCYPVVVAIVHLGLKLRRPSPGDTEAVGRLR
ncbi:rod shape-determining protein MreD [Actibacterium sp.]|uniref:rod shape-determining protein MreD n=1 Tax=Actibacterium sp. TaxID=1872125 RepID=UPI0035686A1B